MPDNRHPGRLWQSVSFLVRIVYFNVIFHPCHIVWVCSLFITGRLETVGYLFRGHIMLSWGPLRQSKGQQAPSGRDETTPAHSLERVHAGSFVWGWVLISLLSCKIWKLSQLPFLCCSLLKGLQPKDCSSKDCSPRTSFYERKSIKNDPCGDDHEARSWLGQSYPYETGIPFQKHEALAYCCCLLDLVDLSAGQDLVLDGWSRRPGDQPQ